MSDDQKTTLAKCPFCGGAPYIERASVCVYYVRCNACSAQGSPVEAMRYERDEAAARRAATKVWNRRKSA